MSRYSAVVPNYNDGAKIAQSLRSLAAQTVPLHDIVIVDDGSTDDSLSVIRDLLREIPQARLIQHTQNQGVVAALNTGIAAVTGDYLFLCSANDVYYPDMVAVCAAMSAAYPNATIISGNVAAFDQRAGRFTHDMRLALPQRTEYYTPTMLLAQARRTAIHFNGGANALRLDRVRALGGLPPALRWHSDWWINLMLAFDGGVVYVPHNFLMCRLEGTKSYSSRRFHWPSEREVIRETLRLLPRYPGHATWFRTGALLPKYQIAALPMLFSAEFRWFVTPLLLWRMVMFSLTYWTKRIFPRPWLTRARRVIRI